jgi:hypothetical protein
MAAFISSENVVQAHEYASNKCRQHRVCMVGEENHSFWLPILLGWPERVINEAI